MSFRSHTVRYSAVLACLSLLLPGAGTSTAEETIPFQLAFVSRVAFDTISADGSVETLTGTAESLQTFTPGVIFGRFREGVLLTDPETDLNPADYPAGSAIVKIRDKVATRRGAIFYAARVAVVPTPDGSLTSALSGRILGGTGIFTGATGTVTLAGKISPCEPGSEFCADSGYRFDCHFILRGTRTVL